MSGKTKRRQHMLLKLDFYADENQILITKNEGIIMFILIKICLSYKNTNILILSIESKEQFSNSVKKLFEKITEWSKSVKIGFLKIEHYKNNKTSIFKERDS